MGTRWNSEELLWLRENSINFTAEELAQKFGRSVGVIQQKCSSLKIKYIAKDKDRFWLEVDKQFLIENASEFTIKEFVEYFNGKYSENAISWQRQQLNLKFKLDEVFWTEDEKEWLVENSINFTRKELAEKFNCSEVTISGICSKLNIEFKLSDYFWSEEEKQLILDNIETHTLKELTELFQNSKTEIAIELYCNRNSIKYIDGRIHRTLDHNFLDLIDTPEKAYFLGWFHSDGYLDKKFNRICFGLTDLEPLEIFNKIFSIEQNIREYKTSKPNHKNQFHWCLGSEKLSNAIQELGYNDNKTLEAKFPKIPENLYYHFIRGFIDGDGCIHIQKKDKTLRVIFVGTESTLQSIKEIFKFDTNVCKTKDNVWSLRVNSIKAYRFLEKVYENSEGLRLTRKYQIWQNYLNSL